MTNRYSVCYQCGVGSEHDSLLDALLNIDASFNFYKDNLEYTPIDYESFNFYKDNYENEDRRWHIFDRELEDTVLEGTAELPDVINKDKARYGVVITGIYPKGEHND